MHQSLFFRPGRAGLKVGGGFAVEGVDGGVPAQARGRTNEYFEACSPYHPYATLLCSTAIVTVIVIVCLIVFGTNVIDICRKSKIDDRLLRFNHNNNPAAAAY